MIKLKKDGNIEKTNPIVLRSDVNYINIYSSLPEDATILVKIKAQDAVKVCQPARVAEDSDELVVAVPITEPMLKAPKVWLSIRTSINGETFESNKVELKLDRDSIQVATTNSLEEVHAKIAELEKRLDKYIDQGTLKNMPELNIGTLDKGMLLTVLDPKGTLGFTYPFDNHITSVNGKFPLNKKISITSKEIPFVGKQNMFDVVKYIKDAIIDHSNSITALKEAIGELAEGLEDVELKVEDMTNTDIL